MAYADVMFNTVSEAKEYIVKTVIEEREIEASEFDVEHVFAASFSFDDETESFVFDAGTDDFWIAVNESLRESTE